jgi:uncharacterized protein
MAVIDADAHVIETDHTWDFMAEGEQQYKPRVVAATSPPEAGREYWVIDGKIRGKGFGNVGRNTSKESRELLDVEARLRHMDELGTDIQVLYPSLLTQIAERPEVEGALWKSYNRWMAEVYGKARGRLRWIARLPLVDMEETLAELRFVGVHGGCGVFLRSIEGTRLLCDPFFFPIYEEASRLSLPICVHASLGNSALVDLFSQDKDNGNFLKFKLSVIGAFHSLVVSDIPSMFPTLRFGFVEVSSDWVPYVVRELQKRFQWKGWGSAGNILRDNHIYVACQIDDDLQHVLQYAGEDNLVIGTDYGHADTSSELEAMRRLQQREDLDPRVIAKILDDNPRALYGL